MRATQHRSVRVDDPTWEAFRVAAAPHGGRASVLRRLIHLYLSDGHLRRRVDAHGDDMARDVRAVEAARSAL